MIAMKEEQETGFMHDLGLGKGQRHAHKTGQSLAQRLIPTLNMGGFSRLFAHGRMLLLEVGSSGSGASRVVRKGGSCATFF